MITFTFIAPFPLLSNGAMQKQFDVVKKEINSNLLLKKSKIKLCLKIYNNYKIKNFEKLKINMNKKKLIKIKYKENVGNMFRG